MFLFLLSWHWDVEQLPLELMTLTDKELETRLLLELATMCVSGKLEHTLVLCHWNVEGSVWGPP